MPIGQTLRVLTAEEANSYLAGKGYTYPPFLANTRVPETMPSQTLRFVRVYNPAEGSNQTGRWIMRAEFVRGLTPEQITARFALPSVPTQITLVEIPANFAPLLTGIAGPIAAYGPGGGQQSYIVGDQYPFPVTAFYHPQKLSDKAMSYAVVVGGYDAGQLASYLDSYVPRAYSDLEGVYDRLDYLNWSGFSSDALSSAIEQLSPEPFDALALVAVRNSLLFGSTLIQRGRNSRQPGGDTMAVSRSLTQLAYEGDMRSAPLKEVSGESSDLSKRVNVWLKGVGEFGDHGSGRERTGFDYKTGGPVLGVDYSLRDVFHVGFGLGYLRTGLNWDNERGRADFDSIGLGLYGGFSGDVFFLEGAVTGGVSWISTERQIAFSDLNRTARSSLTGENIAVQTLAGAKLDKWGWEITPTAELGYFSFDQGSFEEYGADSLNLNVRSCNVQIFRSELKMLLARTFTVNETLKLTPSVNVGWAHQIKFGDQGISAGFSDIGSQFTVTGFDAPSDTCVLGAGLSASIPNGMTFYGYYSGELSGNFNARGVSIGLRYSF